MDEQRAPILTVGELIDELKRFNPDAPLRVETYVEGRGCWTTEIIDIVENKSPKDTDSPLLILGVTAGQYESSLEELLQKLETKKAA